MVVEELDPGKVAQRRQMHHVVPVPLALHHIAHLVFPPVRITAHVQGVVHRRATGVVGMHFATRTLHAVRERKGVRHDLELLRVEPYLLHDLEQIAIERRVRTSGIGACRLAGDLHGGESHRYPSEFHTDPGRGTRGGDHDVHLRRREAEVYDTQVVGTRRELTEGEDAAIVREGLSSAADQTDHRMVERGFRAQHDYVADHGACRRGRHPLCPEPRWRTDEQEGQQPAWDA